MVHFGSILAPLWLCLSSAKILQIFPSVLYQMAKFQEQIQVDRLRGGVSKASYP